MYQPFVLQYNRNQRSTNHILTLILKLRCKTTCTVQIVFTYSQIWTCHNPIILLVIILDNWSLLYTQNFIETNDAEAKNLLTLGNFVFCSLTCTISEIFWCLTRHKNEFSSKMKMSHPVEANRMNTFS